MTRWLLIAAVLAGFLVLSFSTFNRFRIINGEQNLRKEISLRNCEGINNVRLTIRTIITGAYSKPRPDLTEPERFEILGRLLKLVPDPLKC